MSSQLYASVQRDGTANLGDPSEHIVQIKQNILLQHEEQCKYEIRTSRQYAPKFKLNDVVNIYREYRTMVELTKRVLSVWAGINDVCNTEA